MTPTGNRAPDVAVWAVRDRLGSWDILIGLHDQGRYTETLRAYAPDSEAQILTAIRLVRAEVAR